MIKLAEIIVHLANHSDSFKHLDVEIYSVSPAPHLTHNAWHDTPATIGKLQYPMVADPTGAITRNFGVFIEEKDLADRDTFVSNPEGKIQIIEINAGGIGLSATQPLRKIKTAQHVAAHPNDVRPDN